MTFNKTVLQIVPALDAGGAERTTVEIAAAIVEAGGRAIVATSGGRLALEIERLGGVVFSLPVHSKNPLTMAANAFALGRLIRAEGIDLVHVRSRAPAWSALAAARAAKVPLVSTYHGAYEAAGKLKRFYNSGMVRSDLVIANSRFTAASIAAQYEIAPERLRIIPRGADLKAFTKEAVSAERVERLRAEWRIRPGRLTILLPARITPWKGHDLAIRAAERLKSSGTGEARDLQLIFAGDAQGREGYLAQLQRELTDRGVSEMIRLVGHCADMPAAYLIADAVLSASMRPEAFGRTIAEAGAMERIAIAANHGGACEIVVDGETGILFPPGDPEALAKAIEEAAAMTPDQRSMIGAKARSRVEREFSVKAMQSATLAVYRNLLG